MEPRPLAATLLPVAFLAGALGGALAFEGRQVSTGRASLHAVGRRLARELSRSAGQAVALHSVAVEGDAGRTTVAVEGDPFGQPPSLRVYAWRRAANGWEGPLAPAALPGSEPERPGLRWR